MIWNVRYYIDPETGLPHIYNHSVTEEEVEEVLARQDDTCESYMCPILSRAACS